jgi:hypothetical protein
MKSCSLPWPIGLCFFVALFWPGGSTPSALANSTGGTNGTGPNVVLLDNGTVTVTMSNGIVSILCTTAGATINQINYTYNTNITATALAASQSFLLFNAPSYHGAFATVVLPPLPSGFGWNTNQLNTAGAISVLITARPVIQPPALSAGRLIFAGTGGVADARNHLISSSNLLTPLSNWTALATNCFDAGGNFLLTNPLNPAQPWQFFKLEIP